MSNRQILVLSVTLGIALSATAEIDVSKLPAPAKQKGVTYEKDIKPLFEASCIRCHGQERPKAQLRLDSLEGVLKGSKEGPIVVKGDSAKSELVLAVSQLDPEIAMPPKPRERRGGPGGFGGPGGPNGPRGTNAPAGGPGQRPGGPGGPGGPGNRVPAKPLTPEQVGLVRAWVDQGAK